MLLQDGQLLGILLLQQLVVALAIHIKNKAQCCIEEGLMAQSSKTVGFDCTSVGSRMRHFTQRQHHIPGGPGLGSTLGGFLDFVERRATKTRGTAKFKKR